MLNSIRDAVSACSKFVTSERCVPFECDEFCGRHSTALCSESSCLAVVFAVQLAVECKVHVQILQINACCGTESDLQCRAVPHSTGYWLR